ncbi:hypothetical protein [Actinacidiphila oryziradicis]|uniref:Uncharacterized protein n=1 Tax=Actinacidiphila oryziradicis TaxID=2571141 RepID=A0A4U0SFJ1_9ACTN|nr:hypothetical protein [Actinacidiphila oryziradicis]MCW2874536.1 small rane protein [Actinacidiphila oryziradicis]MDX6329912.1 hypothetical protein [Streptomycetaceae bacterium]TKA08354.1 hypothetical protein FCI23_28055 [Actinacidiphila oryziradicis]
MNQVASRIGKTLAFVLPVVLVLSGTLAVTRVPWATPASEAQVLTAAHGKKVSVASAPQEVLRSRLLAELQEKNPGVALTNLQREIAERPSLAQHCTSIARSLGRAAVAKYGPQRAQAWSRPVCDTSFATGIASVR